ncbi:response regulator [bacterium]|nr:response regulator [bacterium]
MTLVRVLYVDDSQFDRELVREALSTEPHFDLVEVATQQEFEDQLTRQSYSVVLSDFNILGYSGLQVIEEVQRARIDVPIIIVTGTGSEQIAVEAMKRGAADYVIKSPTHIRRLPMTIYSVLEQRQLRQKEEQARAELHEFFKLSRDILCVINKTHCFTQLNPAATDVLGYDIEELVGRSLLDIMPHGHRQEVEDQIARWPTRRSFLRFSAPCQTKTGERRWLEWSLSRSADFSVFYGVIRDITDRIADEVMLRERAVAQTRVSILSPREREVIKLVVKGEANKSIAFKIGLSEKTIERHRSNGMKKLAVTSVAELVRVALLAEL